MSYKLSAYQRHVYTTLSKIVGQSTGRLPAGHERRITKFSAHKQCVPFGHFQLKPGEVQFVWRPEPEWDTGPDDVSVPEEMCTALMAYCAEHQLNVAQCLPVQQWMSEQEQANRVVYSDYALFITVDRHDHYTPMPSSRVLTHLLSVDTPLYVIADLLEELEYSDQAVLSGLRIGYRPVVFFVTGR